MLDILKNIIESKLVYGLSDPKNWDTLVINRRKPHTYRMWTYIDGYRVCLHRFNPCEADEVFAHPHPWPGAFLMLKGEYIHDIGVSRYHNDKPEWLYREIIHPGTMYEITHPRTWHKVQPTKETWTIMVNGEPFKHQHDDVKRTKGKDLEKMDPATFYNHRLAFMNLLEQYKKGELG